MYSIYFSSGSVVGGGRDGRLQKLTNSIFVINYIESHWIRHKYVKDRTNKIQFEIKDFP